MPLFLFFLSPQSGVFCPGGKAEAERLFAYQSRGEGADFSHRHGNARDEARSDSGLNARFSCDN
jgi:hypothetical protein